MVRSQISNPSLPAPMRGGAYSSGVEAPSGRTVYVSGQVSLDAEGNVVGEGDVRLQTETVLEHVKTVVEEAGGGMEDIVKVTVFITDIDRKSTRLNSSHANISYAVFCLKKK